jgi:hypothetical protein
VLNLAIKQKDLERYEKELRDVIEKAQNELEAIKTLKQGLLFKIESGNTTFPGHKRMGADNHRGSLAKAIQKQIEQIEISWFTPKLIAQKIIESGIRDEKQWGSLIRKNVGSDEKPVYEYAKSKENKLL